MFPFFPIKREDCLRFIVNKAKLIGKRHDIAQDLFFIARHENGVSESLNACFHMFWHRGAKALNLIECEIKAIPFFNLNIKNRNGSISFFIDERRLFYNASFRQHFLNGNRKMALIKQFVFMKKIKPDKDPKYSA